MNSKIKVVVVRRVLCILIFTFSFSASNGHQVSLYPVSHFIFTPYLFNPAIVGSKDFLSFDINASFLGNSSTQILSGSSRIPKTNPGYFSSPDILEFRNIGVGGSLYNNQNGSTQNIGFIATVSYQIPLNRQKLSFLSMGASINFGYKTKGAGETRSEKAVSPNFDLGIYYFSPTFFTGLSAINIRGDGDTLKVIDFPMLKQYVFTAGYKILISRSMNIILEPSLLIVSYDSTLSKPFNNFNPILKLYVKNLCIGSNFLNNRRTSFFFQYKYPKFYIGALYELPENSPYFNSTPKVELTFGLNIQLDKSGPAHHSHW
jgi:type IX secretion system PorP/SprF family membrane protein